MRLAFFLTFAVAVAACRSQTAAVAVEPAAIQSALTACSTDRVTEGLARLDSLDSLTPGHADVLATRGLCRAVRFAADSVQADARAAFADLSAAADAIQAAPGTFQTGLGQIYNRRAFVVQSLRPDDWPGALADFDRAVAADARNSAYVLDRGVARALSGDTSAARADLRKFVAMVPADSGRADDLRALLSPAPGSPAPGSPALRLPAAP